MGKGRVEDGREDLKQELRAGKGLTRRLTEETEGAAPQPTMGEEGPSVVPSVEKPISMRVLTSCWGNSKGN